MLKKCGKLTNVKINEILKMSEIQVGVHNLEFTYIISCKVSYKTFKVIVFKRNKISLYFEINSKRNKYHFKIFKRLLI